jgi:hypothetical protein
MRWWDQLSIGGEAVSIVGFAVTIWQLLKTKSAANAARQVTERWVNLARRNEFVEKCRELEQIETDVLRRLERFDEWNRTRDLLISWVRHAVRLDEILKHMTDVDHAADLQRLLRASVPAADNAKRKLIVPPQNDEQYRRILRPAITAMAKVTKMTPSHRHDLQIQD